MAAEEGKERTPAAGVVLHAVDGDGDDPPSLSAPALEALKQFLAERQQNGFPTGVEEEEEEDDDDEAEARGGDVDAVKLVPEDWRLSQFWYDRETAETVAEEVMGLCAAAASSSVACIACPTLYVYLKKMDPSISVQLLEYDKRFEQYGSDFTFYDYNQPENLPSVMQHAYPVVVADPPYLSKECLEKVAQTISFLAQPKESYLLLLTGEVQKERAAELLNLQPCRFRPRHSSKLGNEFRFFTNYDPKERLGGWEQHG